MTWRGLGHTAGGPRFMSLNVSYHKKQYIRFRGDLSSFYYAFYDCGRWGDPQSMSLNASYHKKQGYIWFRGGDLNGF